MAATVLVGATTSLMPETADGDIGGSQLPTTGLANWSPQLA
jgi:hypothetical protein